MRAARVPLDVMNYNTAFTAEPPMLWPFLLFLGFFHGKKTAGVVKKTSQVTWGCVVEGRLIWFWGGCFAFVFGDVKGFGWFWYINPLVK